MGTHFRVHTLGNQDVHKVQRLSKYLYFMDSHFHVHTLNNQVNLFVLHMKYSQDSLLVEKGTASNRVKMCKENFHH